MEVFFKLAAIAVTGCICSLCIKKDAPQMALLTGIAAGVVIIAASMDYFSAVIAGVNSITSLAEIDLDIFKPAAKLLAIAAVAKITVGICKDCGCGALAAKIETVSAVASAAVILPFIGSVVKNISELLARF